MHEGGVVEHFYVERESCRVLADKAPTAKTIAGFEFQDLSKLHKENIHELNMIHMYDDFHKSFPPHTFTESWEPPVVSLSLRNSHDGAI